MAKIDYDALIASDEQQDDFTPIRVLGNIVRDAVLQVQPDTEGATDVGFISIIQNPEVELDAVTLSKAILAAEKGYYQDEPLERLLAGPSYIELGAWIGDQGLALALMGLGSALDIWGIITPQTLGIEGEEAKQMMGMGFIMVAPGQESPLRA